MSIYNGYENTVGQVGTIIFKYFGEERQLITIEDYANYFNVSGETVRRYIDEGKLIGIKAAGRWFVQFGEPIVVDYSLDDIPF